MSVFSNSLIILVWVYMFFNKFEKIQANTNIVNFIHRKRIYEEKEIKINLGDRHRSSYRTPKRHRQEKRKSEEDR